jgi:hypothetical protein
MTKGTWHATSPLSPNLQHVLVSKTLFKRLVNHGAVCSECRLPVNIHGGYMPCHGAEAVIDHEVLKDMNIQTIVSASIQA